MTPHERLVKMAGFNIMTDGRYTILSRPGGGCRVARPTESRLWNLCLTLMDGARKAK